MTSWNGYQSAGFEQRNKQAINVKITNINPNKP